MRRLVAVATLAVLASCAPFATPPPAPTATATAAPARAGRIERANVPSLLATGETRIVSLHLENAGSDLWPAAGAAAVKVSYHWAGPESVWDGDRSPLPADVGPGGAIDVVANVRAPSTAGDYTLVWDLVREGAAWFGATGDAARAAVAVRAPEARVAWDAISAPDALYTDARGSFGVKLRNAGTVTWPAAGKDAIALSYHWRDASGGVVVWDGERTKLQDDLAPGESVDAPLAVVTPSAPGRYTLEADLVREGVGWFGQVGKAVVDVRRSSRSSTLQLRAAPKRVALGGPVDVKLALADPSAAPLPDAGPRRARLAYHVVDAEGRLVLWDGPRTELPPVPAGATVEVAPIVLAPRATGRYTFLFDLVQEGVGWFGTANASLPVTVDVVPIDYSAFFAPPRTVTTMATGVTYTASLDVTNVGNVAWPKDGFSPVRLAYHWLDAGGAIVVWDGERTELAKDVAPGERVTLSSAVTPPDRPGTYTLVWDMVQEDVWWFARFGTIDAKATVVVAEPSFVAAWPRADIPSTLTAGTVLTLPVSVRNDTPFAWPHEGEHPVALAHHWRDANGGLVVWDGFRTAFARDVAPGETIDVDVWIFVPATPGAYELELDAVQEGVTWFGQRGSTTPRVRVDVVP